MRESTDWLSKFVTLVLIEGVLLTVILVSGLIMQTVAGYYHYELLQYFKELYLVTYSLVIGFTLLAFFIQTVVPNKFMGHAIVIGLFILDPILFRFGLENTLWLPGQNTPYTYSDMNGYGHFAPALAWSLFYWVAIFAVLACISIAFARRGAEEGWRPRVLQARVRLPRLMPALVLLLVAAIGSGAWFYYNTHVLNEFLTTKQQRALQADYERSFKRYERIPQPKIIAVDANINLDPDRRSFSGTSHFILQNKTAQPIQQIHLTDQKQSVSKVEFDRPFHLVSKAPRDLYAIYQLEAPLAPGDKLNMTFHVGYQTRGFRDGNERPELPITACFSTPAIFPPSATTQAWN